MGSLKKATELSRRAFLLSSLSATLASCTTIGRHGERHHDVREGNLDNLNQGDFFTLDLIRLQDGFSASVEVHGFWAHKSIWHRPRLVSKTQDENDGSRLLVFKFPPQHNAETSLERNEVDSSLGKIAIDELLRNVGLLSSKESTLVFRVPLNEKALPIHGLSMPFELESLLAWEHFEYVLEDADDPYADESTLANRRFFLGLETWKGTNLNQVSAIDLPSGFYFQPSKGETFEWRTRAAPKKIGAYTENWSAFMVGAHAGPVNFTLVDVWGVAGGVETNGDTTEYVNVNKAYRSLNGKPPIAQQDSKNRYNNTPIDFSDRIQFALTLSPRFSEEKTNSKKFRYYFGDAAGSTREFEGCYGMIEHHITASTYGISSDGGFLDVKGNWATIPGCAIKGVEQKTTRGRDTFVKVRRAGFLYPFGFEAELIEETERTYLRDSKGRLVAPLVTKTYIRTVSPTLAPQATFEECFRSIQILTPRTPPLDPKAVPRTPGTNERRDYKDLDAFVVHIDGEPFEFEFLGNDDEGNKVKFSIPVIFVSTLQTDRKDYGRMPEDSARGLPSNNYGANELNYVFIGSRQINFIKLLDENWAKLPYRFADLKGEIIALAPSVESGQTSVEAKWLEWVRSIRPQKIPDETVELGLKYVRRPFTPRVRTARVALQSLRTFAGAVPDMLGTYRDMRVQFNGGYPIPIDWSLDPEEADDELDRYQTGMLDPDKPGNDAGGFFCVLPTSEKTHRSIGDQRDKILDTYFPGLIRKPEVLPLFEYLGNHVGYGASKNTESLGGLATPDGPIALLTRAYGPIGDDRQNIEIYGKQTPKFPVTAFASRVSPRLRSTSNGESTGLINLGIGSIFGDDAEIIPGVKFADILSYILSIGGDSSLHVNPLSPPILNKAPPPAGDNALKWDFKFIGLEWLPALLQLSSVIDLDLMLRSLVSPTKSIEPLENTPVGIEASLGWTTEDITEIDTGFFTLEPRSDSNQRNSNFNIDARAFVDIVDPKPEIKASCSLNYFTLSFLKALILDFNHVRFDMAIDGHKTFDPSIALVSFGGPLSFINGLQSLLKGLEDEFGLKIVISPQRVAVSQVIAFPPGGSGQIILGPAIISNLSFNWGVVIPLIGRDTTRVSMGLASRESPMTISVGIYGGRAYVLLEADTSGPQLIELSSDYGGVFEANFSIAKGSVSLTAGFSYTMLWNDTGRQIDFYAFAQFSGKLSVVSIFSVCTNVILALGFKKGSGSEVIYGIAKCSCSFRIAFKKFKYEYEVYREEVSKSSKNLVALTSQDNTGSACPSTLGSNGSFLPFQDRNAHDEWRQFFDATV